MKTQLSSFLSFTILLALIGSTQASIPTISPENNVLNTNTNYIMSYYNFRPFQASSFFQIDFSQSDVAIPDGPLSVNATFNNTAVSQSVIQANCTNKVCVIRLGTSFAENNNIIMSFGQFRNPRFTAAQRIVVMIYFGVNSNETQSISISASAYLPMPVTVNSITQSDFGVGSQDVTYTMNVSFAYIPRDPEISIQIPAEIGYLYLDTELSFYGTIQNVFPFSTINMLIFTLRSNQIENPQGFMLLTLKGFRNPRFIGTSSSFNVSMIQKRTATTSNCVTCRVAFLYANSSRLLAVSSTTPGDITMNIFNPSSNAVSERISLTVGIKIVAPIPEGGKFRIILPPSITPVIPISCQAVYGFSVMNPAYCLYNQTTNTIETVNFSIPYLETTGDAIIKISVINPKDDRQTQFNFQTLDEQNRKIGRSREPYLYRAVPRALSSNVTKNTTFLESSYTLITSIVLGQTLNPSEDFVQVTLPPSEFYNLSAIECTASSLAIPCTKTIQNITNNLLIRFPPPCSVCNVSSTVSFRINNLINPSFINNDTKTIGIQTITTSGVIQTFTASIDLKEKDLLINDLKWDGNQQVGSDYILLLNYEVPKYVQKYGGFLIINFNQNISFVNVAVSGASYTYPQSLTVLNQNSQALSNVVSYWETSKIKSISQIKVKMCTNDSACGSIISISTLRKPYFPLPSASMSFKAQTLNGDAISASTRDVSALMPQAITGSLSAIATIPTTNTVSNYVFKFKLNRLPFDSGLRVDLTSRHEIQTNGRCFVEVSPSGVLGFGIDCQRTNSTSLVLTYSGDVTFMTTTELEYTLTIVNVLNPPSLMPIIYKVQTSFNSLKTATYSVSYALSQPYSLNTEQLTLSNFTYGQNTNLSIKLRTGYYAFDELKLSIPKENFKAFNSFNGVQSTNGSYKMTENSTFFLIDKIFSLQNAFTIELSNAMNTGASGKIIAQMYVQGYLSSRGEFDLPKITPVYLYATASSSNRFVGEKSTLTFDIRRVNSYAQQKYVRIHFNNSVFEMPPIDSLFAVDQSSPQLYTYTEQLSTWTNNAKSIVLQSFQNMKFIPRNQTLQKLPSINVSTFDQNNLIVATTLIDLADIVSNKTKDSISYTFTRTNVESLNNTDIVVEFVPRYPEMAKLIKIELPVSQNRLEANSSCLIGDPTSTTSCQIIDRLFNTLTIKYPTASTKITLKNIWNQFPSENNLILSLMTQQSELIEQSSKSILPPIDFDILDLTGSANSSAVGSPVKLELTIKSAQNYIEMGSKVKFTLPEKIFSRQGYFMTKDCEYEISGTKYSGCQYEIDTVNDNKQWIQTITVSNFGQSIIMPSTAVKLILYLMNPWTGYSFGQRNITAVQLNSLDQQIAKGSILLNSIYPNVTSFVPAIFQSFSFFETNRQCDQENLFNLTFNLPVPIAAQTSLYLLLPSVYFSFVANQTGYEVESQNANSIKVKRFISECFTFPASSGMCTRANSTLSFMVKVKNQKYLRTINPKPKMIFYLTNDNNPVTNQVEISLNDRNPNALADITLRRNNVEISQNATNTLKCTLPNGFNISNPLKISIIPTVSPISFMKSIESYKFISSAPVSTAPSVTATLNGKQIVLTSSSIPSTSVEMQFKGVNPSFAPNVDNESYTVKIYDDSYIYFSNTFNLTQENRLKPISSGIELKRSTSLVNTLATYTITGSLPLGVDYGRLIFNSSTNISAASSTDFRNLRIGDFVNPSSSNWNTFESVSILNETHIIYMNSRIKTLPDLTSLTLPANTISSIQYNREMRINTEETLTINFATTVANTAKVNIKMPTIFKSIKSVRVNSQPVSSYKVSALTSSQSWIEISLTSPPSKIEVIFMTLQEQRIFANASFILETEFPTQSYQQMLNFNIYGTNLNTSIKLTSTKVNEQNKIEVQVTPLNKINTKLVVYFPTFLNAQLQNLQNDQAQSVVKLVQNNSKKAFGLQLSTAVNAYFFEYVLEQAALTLPLTLTLDKVTNPSSNQPFYFVVEQQELSQNKPIIGHSQLEVKMTNLQQIYVRSAQRSTSKIGVAVEIQTQIELPSSLKQSVLNALASEECVIEMPSVQVVRLGKDEQCEVYLQGQSSGDVKLPCKMHPTLSNAVITTCKAGPNRYNIKKGFKNMLYSIIPNNTQKPYVYIGEPYMMAQSDVASTSFLSPIVTSGSLSLNNLVSSSSVRLQKTQLSLNMTLQNIEEVDCVSFKFEQQNYLYSVNDLNCKSNGSPAECWSSEGGSIMVNITSIDSNNLHIEIDGLVNYLRQGNFTIRTLKYLGQSASVSSQAPNDSGVPKASTAISIKAAAESSFGLIDIFYSSLTDIDTNFVSNTYKTRVINPQNYVSSQLKTIQVIFDDQTRLPSVLDKNLLNFNITTNIPDCQLTNSQFEKSKTLTCNFTQSMDFTLSLKLFHKDYTEIELSSTQFSSYIYPAPTSNCQNQMCDLCSTGVAGDEKCFSCRQNYFEFQNGCIETCPTGFTSYTDYMTCEQCASNCQSCFGLYDSNCIQCQNVTLTSENGLCMQECSSGYAQNGYCVGENECFDQGCRLCSPTGFCYQCLPDYSGEPTCKWQQLLPPFFMIFFAAPFAVYALVSTGIILFMKGAVSMTYQILFSFSLLEFMSWIFIVPALHTKEQAMLMISLIILRIVLGIVAYETYYKKQINSHIGVNEEQSLIEKEKSSQKENESNKNQDGPVHFDEDWKSRVIRFLAHTNGVDSYEAFKVFLSNQIRIQHNNLYLWISTGNRILVCAFMIYVLSQAARGDLIILPVATVLSSLAVMSLRTVKSKTWQELWEKLRGSGR